jgi:hypothetical protein
MTASARPIVAAETLSAASAALTPNSRAMPGSTACTEYSWANVASPPNSSASSIFR